MSSEQKPAGRKSGEGQSNIESLREYAPYLTLGFQLAAAVVLFFLIGFLADSRWDTSPWFTLAGLFIGIVGGFVKFFRTVADLERTQSSTGGKPPG